MRATHPDDFDLGSPEVERCPYPFYAAMRRLCPVYRFPDGSGYFLAKHADVLAALMRPNHFSSHRPTLGQGDPEFEAIAADGYREVPTLTTNDPPAHSRFRRLISRSFKRPLIVRMEPHIRDIVDLLIDRFVDKGRVEFISEFADLLPSYVIADVLGEPREMQPQVKQWAIAITGAVSKIISREQALEYKRQFVEFQHHYAARIEERRAAPGDDLISELVTATGEGDEPLSTEEILDILRVVVNGGNETTAALIGNAMYFLLREPEKLSEVRADTTLIPGMLEEALRLDSPSQWLPRMIEGEDAEVRGVRIPVGSRVLMGWASANHDEDVFPDPERFDIHRDTRNHLAFGHGAHFCPGAALARAESRIAFEELFRRLGDIRPAKPIDDVRYTAQPIIRHIDRLPIEFTAARVAAG
jgi:cytochrome P450